MATRIIYPALENYQRKWRNYRVDKNLKDDWLIRLNNLSLFYITNVCEGHFNCDDQYPRIALMGKKDAIDSLASLFVDPEDLFLIINSNVSSDTHFDFSHTTGVSNDPHSRSNSTIFTPIKLSLTREFPRGSLIFDQKTSEWFDACVHSIEMIDEILHDRLIDHG